MWGKFHLLKNALDWVGFCPGASPLIGVCVEILIVQTCLGLGAVLAKTLAIGGGVRREKVQWSKHAVGRVPSTTSAFGGGWG